MNTAALNNDIVEIRKLHLRGVGANIPNNNGCTPVYCAARKGHTKCIELLNSLGADVTTSSNSGCTPVYIAAYNGHTKSIELLHSLGADVTTATKTGWTPVCIAAEKGHTKCIELLNSLGADVTTSTTSGTTPVYIAAQNGHIKAIELLHSLGADVTTPNNDGWTPVCMAAKKDHTKCIEMLHSLGADVTTPDNDGWTPVCIAAQKGHTKSIELLNSLGADVTTPTNMGTTPVNLAAQNGHIKAIELLHSLGADVTTPNNDGWTPVCMAAKKDHTKCIEMLHSLGADVTTPDNDGWTPVCIAAEKGHTKCIELLNSLGADVTTSTTSGTTPVYIAAQNGHIKAIELLHSLGADVTTPNNDGWTPVCMAAKKDHTKCIEMLHSLGADVTTPDNDGWTPMFIAAQNDHSEIIKLLHSFGADVSTPSNRGFTPVCIAAGSGHIKSIKLLLSLGADVTTPNTNGQTPLIMAIYKHHKETENVLRSLGVTINTEHLDIFTVDDVVEYFEKLGVRSDRSKTIKQNLQNSNTNATALFNIPDAKSMGNLLDPLMHEDWGEIFQNIVQTHAIIQKDRMQSKGAVQRAAEAIKNMDNSSIRRKLFKLQQDVFLQYSKAICFDLTSPLSWEYSFSSLTQSERLDVNTTNNILRKTVQDIITLAQGEEERLGNEVTTVCLQKYQALEDRWAYVEKLPSPKKENSCTQQPILSNSIGIEGTNRGSNLVEERLTHLVSTAKALSAFFRQQIALLTDLLNKAQNPQAMGLDFNDFPLPFNESLLVNGGKRANYTFGPIKQVERALKKAEEYKKEMDEGKKSSECNKLPVSPAEYILDILRCTIEAEDPYVIAVFFQVLLNAKHAKNLHVCRVKNKFIDRKVEKHIRTNVLLNVMLRYPLTEVDFGVSKMLGEFDQSMAGNCLMVCEVQLTLKDFVYIKRLQHSYYDITRVEEHQLLPFLLETGAFIDHNTMEEKIPKVIEEMMEKKQKKVMSD
eukprot:CAMPEP_0194446954 /NCGR_PEP_ID=MMETSP0176-20130528/128731_1 /TAXON_ID=216777 /ORGANISM="Proboscia alata, Strain PI-D3" /LENGTH=978 /DNA_ID=CAMNT_0039273741 /DNA_START=121 /DNA_END=3057 /DNA_ORIENTATION=+